MSQYTMKPVADCGGDYPDALLREWARDTLGAVRCSASYLAALRITLGNMARAHRHGATLHLTADAPFASRQTMRTILGQLLEAGLVTSRGTRDAGAFTYRSASPADDSHPLERLYREAEDMAFNRYRQSVGLCVGDIPY